MDFNSAKSVGESFLNAYFTAGAVINLFYFFIIKIECCQFLWTRLFPHLRI